MSRFLINDIRLSLDGDEARAISRARRVLVGEGLDPRDFSLSVYRRSIDARDKGNILLVYSVLAASETDVRLRNGSSLREMPEQELEFEHGSEELHGRPTVVGMGPAGLFCALLLAEHGYCPVIIDRGDDVARRTQALARFVSEGVLDTESNVQFGAGGAGTFSDGKLTTRINDPRCAYVLSRFVEFGAPKEILTRAKPHIGTDILASVVQNMLSKIEASGGTVIYRCRLDDYILNGSSVRLITTSGEMDTGAVVLALGHSARDTYRMLMSHGLIIEPKPYSVGVRVEHLQQDIDTALYGKFAGHPALGHAEYNLSDTRSGRGVYTFCMCPGGEVVPATSQEGGVCVNGMSTYARDGKNANCAVNVSVYPEDYGSTPLGAIELQEELERRAYRLGGGDYFAPIQTMGDFLNGTATHEPSRIMPTYAGGARVHVAPLDDALPTYVAQRLREGFGIFDKKISGFAVPDAVLTGVETRTSAPVRIMRSDELTAIGNPLIYPCGEGAGYSGGIMSSAVDGIKVALEIIKKYAK